MNDTINNLLLVYDADQNLVLTSELAKTLSGVFPSEWREEVCIKRILNSLFPIQRGRNCIVSLCLFIFVFVCRPQASFALSSARLTAVQPSRPLRQNTKLHLMSVCLVSAGQGALFSHQHLHLRVQSILFFSVGVGDGGGPSLSAPLMRLTA